MFSATRIAAALALACATLGAQAHSVWMKPSSTVLSKADWVTVDAAVSNDMFFFNHRPLGLDKLVITAPDGSTVEPKNAHKGGPVYPVDVAVEAADRQGLLRDISDVFAREKTNVIGVQTQSVKGTAWMTFTVEVADSGRLNKVLGIVANVSGVRSARRR